MPAHLEVSTAKDDAQTPCKNAHHKIFDDEALLHLRPFVALLLLLWVLLHASTAALETGAAAGTVTLLHPT